LKNNDEGIPPKKMLQGLCADDLQIMRFLRATHEVCDRHDDVDIAGLKAGSTKQNAEPAFYSKS
jgi:hypothetical protein